MSATAIIDDDGPASAQPSAMAAAPGEARLQLLWRLADVLSLPDGRTTANDRAMVADMMAAVLGAAEPALRAEVARRLAMATGLPPSLIRQIATDVPAVARTALLDMTEVPDAVLTEAAGVSLDHRLLLAERDPLTGALAEAMLCHDEPQVITRVLGARGVTLSPARVEALVARSRNDVALRRLLLARPELRPVQGFAMFWWCGPADRRRILARFAMDRTVLQDTLQPLFPVVFTDEAADPLVKRMLRLIDRRHRPRGTNGEVVTPDVVERTLAAARAMPTPEFCHAVGLLAGVGTDTATRVLHDGGGEPFAILAKSAGLSRGAFARVLEEAAAMPKGEGPQGDGPSFDGDRREALAATFDTVARDYARAVLQYWDWRPEAGGGTVAPTAPPPETGEDAAYLGAV